MSYGDSMLECNWKAAPNDKEVAVSDNGRIMRHTSKGWNELKPTKNKSGYYTFEYEEMSGDKL